MTAQDDTKIGIERERELLWEQGYNERTKWSNLDLEPFEQAFKEIAPPKNEH